MSTNVIKVISAVTKEISRRFDVKADLINATNRQYDEPHAAWKANSGSSIEIKQPQKLKLTRSATLEVQYTTETTATLNVNQDAHVGLGFTATQMTQDLLNPSAMKMFGDDYLDSAIDNIIAGIQGDYHTFIKNNVYNSVGAPGTGPTSYQVVTQARAKLNAYRTPKGNRSFILNSNDAALLNNAQVGLFNPNNEIASNYKDGALSPSNGFAFYECEDIGNHTNGAGASYAVDGAGQTGSSILLKTGTNPITKGSTITFALTNASDPVSGASKPFLQQFTVTADFAGGAGNIAISPAITTSGALQTVANSPADSAGVVISGSASATFGAGIALHRDAFVFGTARLADIGVKYEHEIVTGGAGTGYSRASGPQKGVSMKLYMDGDITNRRSVARLDIKYGFAALVPEWATLVAGQ